MNKPYIIYLGGSPVSDHETFPEALEAYRKQMHRAGVNMRNRERSDVDYNGLTDEELDAIESLFFEGRALDEVRP